MEVHLSGGPPGTAIVGLPEVAVRGARSRAWPSRRRSSITRRGARDLVNLAPADLPKDGGRFDPPIALGILAANGALPLAALQGHEFLGELALSGELRAVTGAPARPAQGAGAQGRCAVIPAANAAEAALLDDAEVRVAHSLLTSAPTCAARLLPRAAAGPLACRLRPRPTWPRCAARRRRACVEPSAAGGHHLVFVGPPGTGKTLLASRLPGILPPLSEAEALESGAVRSVAGLAWIRRVGASAVPRAAPHRLGRGSRRRRARSRAGRDFPWPIMACCSWICPSSTATTSRWSPPEHRAGGAPGGVSTATLPLRPCRRSWPLLLHAGPSGYRCVGPLTASEPA